MKKKNKEKKIKTKEQRLIEINKIKEKIESFGITESFENIDKLYNIFDTYVDDGISESGKINLPGLKRELHYILSSKPHIVNNVCLKYNENI